MGFDHRKLLLSQNNLNSHNYRVLLPKDGKEIEPPPPLPGLPPPPPPAAPYPNQKHVLRSRLDFVFVIIGAFFLFCITCKILAIFCTKRRNRRRTRSAPIFFGTQGDFVEEDQGPAIDHPIWYINTEGFQQSVIDSITIFKYKKGEGLTEGTECSVCLTEFQEDESLRLLPKCSHAFHIPCIDTWLRSHKNCPLCRAPVVSDNVDVQVPLTVPTTSDLSSRQEPQMENSENNSRLISNQDGEAGTSEVRNGDHSVSQLPIEDETNDGNSKKNLGHSILHDHSRVQSDLVDTTQGLEAEMQPMRRSVSLDFTSASAIYNAVANVAPGKRQPNSDTQLVQPNCSKSKRIAKRGSTGNVSFCYVMKSSSIGRGRSLKKGPTAMERSVSSSSKSSSLPRHCTSQALIRSF